MPQEQAEEKIKCHPLSPHLCICVSSPKIVILDRFEEEKKELQHALLFTLSFSIYVKPGLKMARYILKHCFQTL